MSEEIDEPRRTLLGAAALGFVAAQFGAPAPAFAQNNTLCGQRSLPARIRNSN
jgi:hypothetical protein